jgi:hypothetical protein
MIARRREGSDPMLDEFTALALEVAASASGRELSAE